MLVLNDRALVSLLMKPGYEYTYHSEGLHFIRVPSRAKAYQFIQNFSDTVDRWNGRKFLLVEKELIEIGNGCTRSINMSDFIQIPGIKLTLPILRVFDEILSNQRSAGIVLLPSHHQIAANAGENGKFMLGRDTETVTQWKREQYYNPEDLIRMNQFIRDTSVDSTTWKEFTYRVFDPDLHTPETGKDNLTHQLTTEYQLRSDGLGNVFQYFRNKEIITL